VVFQIVIIKNKKALLQEEVRSHTTLQIGDRSIGGSGILQYVCAPDALIRQALQSRHMIKNNSYRKSFHPWSWLLFSSFLSFSLALASSQHAICHGTTNLEAFKV
jgi:hypothetical protein